MSKILLIVSLIFLSKTSFSQCENILKTVTDKFTGEQTVLSNGSLNIKNFSFSSVSKKNAEYVILEISTNNIECINDISNVIFLMRGGEKVEMANFAKMNCKGISQVYLNFKSSKVIFGTITDIRVNHSEGFTDLEMNEKESQILNTFISCAYTFR